MDENVRPGIVDITNGQYVNRKRLSNGEIKAYKVTRKPRKTLDFMFKTDCEKLLFEKKFEQVKSLLKLKSNTEVFDHLMDSYIKEFVHESEKESLQNQDDNLDLFLCSKQKLFDLVRLSQRYGPLEPLDMDKIGHVARLAIKPLAGRMVPFFWHSSSAMAEDYTINYRLIHSYLCAGMFPAQYERLCDFAKIGLPVKRFREKMFPTYGISVRKLRDQSIKNATEEELTLSNRDDGKIDIMTDARHACRKNSYHTDVSALGQLTHKIVGYVHVTKEEERSSQRHELYGTKKLYENFQRRQVNVGVHSHDRNSSVSTFLSTDHPGVTDSYDTWHGTKEVRRSISKVTKGAQKNIGRTWHPELRDKLAGVKTHVYWSMRNCNGNAQQLRGSLDNIVNHYKNDHRNCHATSGCQRNGYVPSRDIIVNQSAENLLTNAIRSLYIYKHPYKYTHCRDTHYIESYHNTILIHIDKRLHFHSQMYDIKLGIAILDWNEHVDRPATSVRNYIRHDRPRHQAGYRVLKPKTYSFVELLWTQFTHDLANRQVLPVNQGNISDVESGESDDDSTDDDVESSDDSN